MHDHVRDLVEVLELAGAAQQVGAVAFVDFAERHVLVLGAEHVDRRDRPTGRAPVIFSLRQLDVDLPAQAAVDRDRGDAGDALEARRQVVLGDLAQRDRGRSRPRRRCP